MKDAVVYDLLFLGNWEIYWDLTYMLTQIQGGLCVIGDKWHVIMLDAGILLL